MVYDAEEDEISGAGLGSFSIWAHVSDNFGADNTFSDDSDFIVDDLVFPVNLAADNSAMGLAYGFNILASGTMVRGSGAAVSIDNAWLIDENINTLTVLGASNSYLENYTILADPGAENIYVRVWGYDGVLDGENYGYYDVNENRLYQIIVRWEENYELVPDGDNENSFENRNYHLTYYFDNYTREFDLTTNPENIIITEDPIKVRLTLTENSYWRTRVPQTPGDLVFIVPDDIDNLYYYEFVLKDLTGDFGRADNGQLWLRRYYEDNFMPIHEDYWDVQDVVIAWLVYGTEYDIFLVTASRERASSPVLAGATQEIEIIVGTFLLPSAINVWDNVSYSVRWTGDNYIRVAYEDNLENTVSAVVRIIDENLDTAYNIAFTADQWTLTWTGGDPNTSYIVEIDIDHDTYGTENITTRTALALVWEGPLHGQTIPGMSQLGDVVWSWGAAIVMFLVTVFAATFGARHEGVIIFGIALLLVVLGPMAGAVVFPELLIPLVAVIGVIVMLTPKRV